jgi:3-oxoacyl-[acyl-carrier protein] reductase
MDLGLTGRVALVTAGSRGIGRAIAEELVAEGARVAITSRSPADAASSLGVLGVAHDSRDLDAVPAVVSNVVAELGGPVEILVVNTGGPPAGEPLSFSRALWEDAYRELVLHPMAFVDEVMPSMRARRWGRIVNVVSTSVREPLAHLMLSNAHRSATLAAWKTLAREVAADGVTLNSVLPGQIATDRIASMFGGDLDAAQEAARSHIPAGRLGEPSEMGAAAAFLCSERAAYITGVALLVDGGLTRSI